MKINLSKALKNFELFSEIFLKIRKKDGSIVPFIFNAIQKKLFKELKKNNRLIILKSRQVGISTFSVLYGLWQVITKKNQQFIIVAHKLQSAQKIFTIVKLAYDNLPDIIKPEADISNVRELRFNSINSGISVTTSTSEGLRGGTFSGLHISEYAFNDYPEFLYACLPACPPSTPIIIESTANGIGNDFHKLYTKAEAGKTTFVPLFFPWFEDDTCCIEIKEDSLLPYTEKEEELISKYNLTYEQIAFRRQISELYEEKRPQEYPENSSEAFLITDASVFTNLQTEIKEPIGQGSFIGSEFIFLSPLQSTVTIYEKPDEAINYFIGYDANSGIGGGDDAVAQVIGIFPQGKRQVAIMRLKDCALDLQAVHLNRLGHYYNNAEICVESNTYGLTVIDYLKNGVQGKTGMYPRLWKRLNIDSVKKDVTHLYGFLTTPSTKSVLVNTLKGFLRTGDLKVVDKSTDSELRGFMLKNKNNREYYEGKPDDAVIALALALYICKDRTYHPRQQEEFIPTVTEIFRGSGY